MGLEMLGGTGHHESLGHGRRVKPTRTGWTEKLTDGEMKGASWRHRSDACTRPCAKNPKTFILYLPRELSLIHGALGSLLAISGYFAALIFLSGNLHDLCPVPTRHSASFPASLPLHTLRTQMASLLQPRLCTHSSHSLTLPERDQKGTYLSMGWTMTGMASSPSVVVVHLRTVGGQRVIVPKT